MTHSRHPATKSPCHRSRFAIGAFTLIELLVVIAIIALLVGLLLPALGGTRRSAWRAVSLANIRSNLTYAAAYSNDWKDDFVNPFVPGPRAKIIVPDDTDYEWYYSLPDSLSGSESYGYHWISHTLYHDHDITSRVKSSRAPGDKALAEWMKTARQFDAQTDFTYCFASSYWYPPVFWQNWTRFEGPTRAQGTKDNKFFIRRNKVADVVFPSKKVQLFEGKDYASVEQRMWNLPGSRPCVGFVDGGCRTVNMSAVIDSTDKPSASPSPDHKLLYPAGAWDPTPTEMDKWMLYGAPQGFTWTYGNPAYFWATRNGIRGIDVR